MSIVTSWRRCRAGAGCHRCRVADGGGGPSYFKGEQIKSEEAGVVPIVPKTLTSNSLADGRFDKQDFILHRQR